MTIAWLHADCLRADWFAPRLAPGDRAVYVFDDKQLASDGWGLKRIQFVYETLLELPVEIHRGATVEMLTALAGAGSAVLTVDTPDPWVRAAIAGLRQRVPVEVLPSPVFVELDGRVDLKRFSRYWSKAERKLLA